MNMATPAWANEEITKLLPEIRAKGEGPSYEFKEDFPEQSHGLAKEVAAVATSGGGLILIGVRDDGTVAGLDENERDKLYHRAKGIASQVQPRVDCDVSLCYDEKFILVVCIRDKQSEPVFYYDYRPYLRDGRSSRPATPDEVKGFVWKHGSSEKHRRHEELMMKMAEDHHAQMSKMRESYQRTSELSRLAFIPRQS
jgi:predicted HTH transcriptional regulator